MAEPEDEGMPGWAVVVLTLVSIGIPLAQLWMILPDHRKELVRLRLRRSLLNLVGPWVAMRARRQAQSQLSWEVFLALGQLKAYDDGGGNLEGRLELA